jgi:hypothetical protein
VVYENKVILEFHAAQRYKDARGTGGIAAFINNLGARWRNVIALHSTSKGIRYLDINIMGLLSCIAHLEE